MEEKNPNRNFTENSEQKGQLSGSLLPQEGCVKVEGATLRYIIPRSLSSRICSIKYSLNL
jgi:hypothetical protein